MVRFAVVAALLPEPVNAPLDSAVLVKLKLAGVLTPATLAVTV